MHNRKDKAMMQHSDLEFELKRYPKHVAYLFQGHKLKAIATNKWGQHAEMGLMTYVTPSRKPQVMYVKRVSAHTQMSRPCVRCSTVLKKLAPHVRVFYSNDRGDWIEDVTLDNTKLSRSDPASRT